MKVKVWGFNEEDAIRRYPYGKNCPERSNGLPHRVGDFPMSCSYDGGLPGNHTKAICIHCGKEFPKKAAFYPINQPRGIK
jgi:hypothetical protein